MGLGKGIKSRATLAGSARVEGHDLTQKQVGMPRPQGLFGETKAGSHIGSKGGDQDIGPSEERLQNLSPLRTLQLERNTALPSVGRQVEGALATPGRWRPGSGRITGPGAFDLQDLSAQIPQDLSAKGAGQIEGKIENSDPFQGLRIAHRSLNGGGPGRPRR
jgi:hypothetical protein